MNTSPAALTFSALSGALIHALQPGHATTVTPAGLGGRRAHTHHGGTP